MSNLIRLGKSGIEYLTHQWGFFSGCRHKQLGLCPPEFRCWAETITKRFKGHYPNDFEPTFYPDAFLSPLRLKKPSRIGCAFMGDLFGDWVDPEQMMMLPLPEKPEKYGSFMLQGKLRQVLFGVIRTCPQHTFLFLTKNPAGLLKWSPFPDNCEVGFSACNREMLLAGCRVMQAVEARVKFVSIEPMLEDTWCLPSTLILAGINWVIIGAQTRPYLPPQADWVKTMVQEVDIVGARIFLKDNLFKLMNEQPHDDRYWEDLANLRQELPDRRVKV